MISFFLEKLLFDVYMQFLSINLSFFESSDYHWDSDFLSFHNLINAFAFDIV